MGSLLNSLVVLTLLFAFIAATATATAAARPTTISRLRLRDDGGDESEEEFPPQPNGMNRFLNRFPGFLFGRHRPQQENPPPEETETEIVTGNPALDGPVNQENPPPEETETEIVTGNPALDGPVNQENPPTEENEEEVAPLPENGGKIAAAAANGGRKKAGPAANGVGSWAVDSENAGVSAMHIQLMPNNKAVWYDSTSNGLSEIKLNPPACKPRVGGRQNDPQLDCTAHAIEYDIHTAEIRPLKVDFSPWCSSGGLSRDGNLISTGGDKDGFRAVRILKPCPTCNFQENSKALYTNRWYATQHALGDGTIVLVGGRNAYNYEIVQPDTLQFTPKLVGLPLLEQTSDDGGRENNLYPFVNLLPDGNLFIFANYKSIILNPATGKIVRPLPDLAGGSRNYPASAMSALLPIDLRTTAEEDVEVLVCGGNTREAYTFADLQQPKRTFLPASRNCGRLRVNVEGAEWETEDMPSPRVMGDMLLLPNGDVLMLNGAKAGTSAWDSADIPNLTPVLYSPNKKKGDRFRELAPTTIPRMYHSVSAVLPDGKVLVAGSNTNALYKMKKYNDKFKFPTELRVEKFLPPYLAPELEEYRLEITEADSDKEIKYGEKFSVGIKVKGSFQVTRDDIKVTMYSPPFTTHGYSQNQRLLILKVRRLQNGRITVVAPPSGNLAPPGYYLLFVVYGDVPSRGIWVNIQ